jgi:ATP-dependent helicase/nuclease subunit A
MERAPISTIHSFCLGLLKEYPVEAGVDPQFTLLDEVQSGAFEYQTWEHWLKKNLSQPVEPLFQFLRLGGTFEHVDELKQFLKSNRTLLNIPASQTLPSMEPFKEKWKGFLAWSRKSAKGCSNPTDLLYQTLEEFWAKSERIESAKPEDADFELAALKVPKAKTKGNLKSWDKAVLAEIRGRFEQLREDHAAAFAPFREAVLLNLLHWIGGYLSEWESQKVRNGFLDFEDLLLKTRNLLRDHPDSREEIKKRFDTLFVDEFQDTDPLQVEIVFFLSERPAPLRPSPTPSGLRGTGGFGGQVQVINWKDIDLEPGKLFLVGDPKQSIYRFRRADVAIYEATKERILVNGGKVEKLTENFRTVGGLVEWVNGCFPALFEGSGISYQALNASREKGKTEGTLPILWGLKVPIPEGSEETKSFYRRQEAEWVAAYLKEKILKGGWTVSDPQTHKIREVRNGDIAILFRDLSNENEEFWEEALRKRDLPYQIVGGKRFYNRPEIVALSTLLTCLSSPADEAACVAVLRGPLFGFSDEELFLHRDSKGYFRFQEEAKGNMGKAFEHLRKWFNATRTLGVSETLSYLYEHTNLLAITAGQPHGEQRVANLMKVLDQARNLETTQHFTYRAFTQWLTTQQEEGTMEGEAPGPDSSEDRITLMTIHKAKGLEFPIVFVSAWASDPKDSGSLVDRKAMAGAYKVGRADLGLKTTNYDSVKQDEEVQQLAENTRLLYVAATRARDCLLLSHFQMPAGGKYPIESLFAGPLLKALEEKEAPLRWAEPAGLEESLDDPPVWAVNLKFEREEPALKAEKEKLESDRQKRKAKIEGLKRKRTFKSVTSVLSVDEEKKETEERIWEGPEPTSPWGGRHLGTLTHLLLEKGWDWDASTLKRAALVYAEKSGVAEPQAGKAAEWAGQALASELLQRARKSGKVFKELPLTCKGEDGTFLNAVIDLAFLEDGKWVIVDYKTDRDMEKEKEKYEKQLGYYSELLTRSTGFPVKERWLYFLQGQPLRVGDNQP